MADQRSPESLCFEYNAEIDEVYEDECKAYSFDLSHLPLIPGSIKLNGVASLVDQQGLTKYNKPRLQYRVKHPDGSSREFPIKVTGKLDPGASGAGTGAAPAGAGTAADRSTSFPLLTPSAFYKKFTKFPHPSLTTAALAGVQPLSDFMTSFNTWAASRMPNILELLSRPCFANDQIPACGREPDKACYRAHAEVARQLVLGLYQLMYELSDEQMQDHPVVKSIHILVDAQVSSRDKDIGTREPDYALYLVRQGSDLGRILYDQLIWVGEMVEKGKLRESALVQEKLTQCFDHVTRASTDRQQYGNSLQLPFEVSDGQFSRCGLGLGQSQQVCAYFGDVSLDLTDERPVALPTGQDCNAWLDKLLLAFIVCKHLPPHLRAAAPQVDTGSAPHSGATMVAAGSIMEIELAEVAGLQLIMPSSSLGSPSNTASTSSTSPCSPVPLLHHSPAVSVSSKSASSNSPSSSSPSAIASSTGVCRREVRIDATLAEHNLSGTQALVLSGTLQPASDNININVTSGSVVVRLVCGDWTSPTVPTEAQQLEREVCSLRLLRGAGTPYLPSLVASGVVTAGPDGLVGASALVMPWLGDPLHKHLAGGDTLAASYVLLLGACLAASCCTLTAHAVIHGDVRPANITASMLPHPPHCHMFHLVDLGASCSIALDNDRSFRHRFCYPSSCDLSTLPVVGDPIFSSLRALRRQPLLPFADLEGSVYTLVFLASGALPWTSGAEESIAGRERAFRMGSQWEPLATLPPPVASFAAWVLAKASSEAVPLEELHWHTAQLFLAVQQELGVSLPWPAGTPD